MGDYLTVEYSNEKRPLTNYLAQLASYLADKYKLQPGQSILEVGCGRCEILGNFRKLNLKIYGIDNAPSAGDFAREVGAEFASVAFVPGATKQIFNGMKFDVIFSKSFVEHIFDTSAYFEWCKSILVDGGKIITLTPCWESNYRIFFDDFTHVKPFTIFSLNQALETSGFSNIEVIRFRQLPITWKSKTMNALAALTAIFSHHRSKSKWMRWSRELMIASVGTKPASS